ncbi:HNHc domain containing protein [uncultured Caudovirales phage]|uniref:HNHc domain containing protein n=1 Tax=uncultured Caudovirales phage TaxID=2100421 RepID=A0A6J5QDX8_9CAUD|nr:HNHc domain containing protein [uncultured Caudovirales phage]CAB4182649.1 HNHc domain containing protein [uncultured Caudovirales phage]CAB4198290.1 HNHc domain containing protein [uncultured Caudovirales phage]CAB4211285.1 HNHc domain containing protein [uncultured Caudovirales phage]CAB5237977.1 HNHc domain containing protein [uncultured Caudovirales phage]
MAEPRQMKLHNLPVMKISQRCKCVWCEYGRDPGPSGLCRPCMIGTKKLLQGTKWHRLRIAMLSLPENLYCTGFKLSLPAGIVSHECRHQIPKPCYIIDHIVPWQFSPSLFWEPTNHQAICEYCHGIKSSLDNSHDNSPKGQQA